MNVAVNPFAFRKNLKVNHQLGKFDTLSYISTLLPRIQLSFLRPSVSLSLSALLQTWFSVTVMLCSSHAGVLTARRLCGDSRGSIRLDETLMIPVGNQAIAASKRRQYASNKNRMQRRRQPKGGGVYANMQLTTPTLRCINIWITMYKLAACIPSSPLKKLANYSTLCVPYIFCVSMFQLFTEAVWCLCTHVQTKDFFMAAPFQYMEIFDTFSQTTRIGWHFLKQERTHISKLL